MTAAVTSDAAIATRGQKEHLVLKRGRAQRPAVAKDNGLTRAPVVEVDLCSVLGGNRVHSLFSFRAFLSLKCPTSWLRSILII